MKQFKDIDLTTIPEPVAALLKAIIPENADVEFDFSDPNFGVLSAIVGLDPVRDGCSAMGCKDCADCPIEKATTVNINRSMAIIAHAYRKLASLVRLNGNISQIDRQAAVDALGELINEGDYVSALLEGDVNV